MNTFSFRGLSLLIVIFRGEGGELMKWVVLWCQNGQRRKKGCWRNTLHESVQAGPAVEEIIFSTVKAVYTFQTALTASLWEVVYMNLFWENSIRRDPRFLHKSLNLACVLIKKKSGWSFILLCSLSQCMFITNMDVYACLSGIGHKCSESKDYSLLLVKSGHLRNTLTEN